MLSDSLANAAFLFFSALASVQLAILCLLFARHGDQGPTARWWSAALIVQALRLALIGADDALPAAIAVLLPAAGHAPVAVPILAGTLALFGFKAWHRPLLALSGLTVAAIAAAPLYGSAIWLVDLALSGLATAALIATTGFVWGRYITRRWSGYLAALPPLLCLSLYLLVDTISSVQFGWSYQGELSEGWGLTVNLGLCLVTLISLVHVLQARAIRDALEADARLSEAIESLPHGVALFDAEDRLVICNSMHAEFHPQARPLMVPGRPFEDILRDVARLGAYEGRGEDLERFVEKRIASRRVASGQPIIVSLSDGRWLQLNETRTVGGGIVTAWSDITTVKRSKQALGILIAQDAQGRSVFDTAAEALAVGLDCRWAGVAEFISDTRARTLSMWADGRPQETVEYDTEGTPCARLHADSEQCLFPDRLPELFPRDRFLADIGAISYRGQVICDANGARRSYVFVMDDKPMTDETGQNDMIALIARWVGMAYRNAQAERDLRDSQHRFRDFAESASDWFWELDENLRFSFFSHDLAETAGVPTERLLGRTREELLAAGDPTRGDRVVRVDWDAHLADLKARRPFRRFIHPRLQPDGSVRYLSLDGRPIFDDAGNFKGYRGSARNITERILAEHALRTSQASLSNAQRLARLGNWDWDLGSRKLLLSEEIYRIFGLEPQTRATTFEAFLERVHPNDRKAVQAAVDDALAGAPFAVDHRIVYPDGQVRIVHQKGEVELDAQGRPAFMRGTAQDVTEQRQALAALAEREQRIRAITDNVRDALITIDTGGIMESANPATERIFGYSTDELVGSNVSMLMAEPERSQHDSYLAKYQRSGQARVLRVSGRESVGRRKDGTLVNIEIWVSEMFHGRKALFVGAIRDITERVRAREGERRKVLFVELSKTVSAAANEATSLSKALQTGVDHVCSLLGWPLGHVYVLANPKSEILEPSGLWHAADADRYAELIRLTNETRLAAGSGTPGRVLQSGQAVCIADTERDDGDPRIDCARRLGLRAMLAFPIMAGSQVAGVIEFFSTAPGEPEAATVEVMEYVGAQLGRVVERAGAERALITAKESAETANRAKTEFLATMSHELRTPLNAVIGFSELMADEAFGPLGHRNYKDYAGGILSSGSHLLRIINDILDVSKAEAGHIVLVEEPVDIDETIEAALGNVRQAAEGKGLELKVDIPAHAPRVRADKLRLKQIVLNLLSNAVKFTARGTVTVRVRATEDGLCLQVIDTGIGIAEDDMERVFEPFMQAEHTFQRNHEGTGLGLPLSRSLAKLHGGTLTLESKFGFGTAATLRLPAGRMQKDTNAA